MRTSPLSVRFNLKHVLAVVFSLAMLSGAIRLGIAALLIVPLLVPCYALALGIIASAGEETDEGDRMFLVAFAVALLVVIIVVIGMAQILLHGR